jgi:hypothetical protein
VQQLPAAEQCAVLERWCLQSVRQVSVRAMSAMGVPNVHVHSTHAQPPEGVPQPPLAAAPALTSTPPCAASATTACRGRGRATITARGAPSEYDRGEVEGFSSVFLRLRLRVPPACLPACHRCCRCATDSCCCAGARRCSQRPPPLAATTPLTSASHALSTSTTSASRRRRAPTRPRTTRTAYHTTPTSMRSPFAGTAWQSTGGSAGRCEDVRVYTCLDIQKSDTRTHHSRLTTCHPTTPLQPAPPCLRYYLWGTGNCGEPVAGGFNPLPHGPYTG